MTTTPRRRLSRRVELEPGALKRAREDAGLSIAQLATATGLSYAHLAQVERGRYGISAPALHLVTEALGLTIADLRRQEDNGPAAHEGCARARPRVQPGPAPHQHCRRAGCGSEVDLVG